MKGKNVMKIKKALCLLFVFIILSSTITFAEDLNITAGYAILMDGRTRKSIV